MYIYLAKIMWKESIFINSNLLYIYRYTEYYFLSHLEIVKDVTKEILRRNLIQTR
jgi:hypothetical protein